MNHSILVFIFAGIFSTMLLSAEYVNVSSVLNELGESFPDHYNVPRDTASIIRGQDLYFKGKAISPKGVEGTKISEVFTCNHCHNTKREDPDLAINDPEQRLQFAIKNNLPFLQGTTMYGAVNRKSWFNDDYLLKYGEELIAPARNNLIEAIKLCSKECSMGRDLEHWEADSIASFLWSLQYKISDLKFTPTEKEKVKNYQNYKKEEIKELILSKYLSKSSATFVKVPSNGISYGYEGDPVSGRQIYESSCLHCHNPETSVSHIIKFKNKKSTFKYLAKFKNNYHALRDGIEKKKSYMPLFSKERMSNKQLDDLKSYIDLRLLEGE
jgi:cytochrome c5